MTAPNHALADALHLLGDLAASGRLTEGAGFWTALATSSGMAEDIAAALTDADGSPDTGAPMWTGFLLGVAVCVRVVDVAQVEVAAAALTLDAGQPGGIQL